MVYIVLMLTILFIGVLLWCICNFQTPAPLSSIEQDEETIYMLQRSGWTEKEIQDYKQTWEPREIARRALEEE